MRPKPLSAKRPAEQVLKDIRRATATAPRTLAARIAKLEEARPSDEVTQALVKELMELLRCRKRGELMRPLVAKMLQHSGVA